jgi:hypothetical protein
MFFKDVKQGEKFTGRGYDGMILMKTETRTQQNGTEINAVMLTTSCGYTKAGDMFGFYPLREVQLVE